MLCRIYRTIMDSVWECMSLLRLINIVEKPALETIISEDGHEYRGNRDSNNDASDQEVGPDGLGSRS